MLELHHQLSRGLPLDELHDLARRQRRRTREQHMDMIPRNSSLQNLDLIRATDLAHQVPNPGPHYASEDRLAVLGDPHKMVLDIEAAMRSRPVVLHPPIL